jgi:hypothetical protein
MKGVFTYRTVAGLEISITHDIVSEASAASPSICSVCEHNSNTSTNVTTRSSRTLIIIAAHRCGGLDLE